MRAWLGYIALGAFAYVGFLVAGLPAQYVHGLVAPHLGPVHLSGISGTVWSGGARSLQAQDLQLEALTWRLQPTALLRARLEVALSFQTAAGPGELRIGRRLPDTDYVREANFNLPAAQLAALAQLGPVGLDGVLRVRLQEITLHQTTPVAASGAIQWQDAAAGVGQWVTLGDFALRFLESTDAIVAELRDEGGVLDLRGELRLTPDRRYAVNGTVAPRADASDEVVQAVRMIGTPQGDGRFAVSLSGTW
jgi:hypothetical protein